MDSFEIAFSIIGTLIAIIGTISTIFLNRLLRTLDRIQKDLNGIKLEVGKIVTTQMAHEDKFEIQDKRIERIETQVYGIS